MYIPHHSLVTAPDTAPAQWMLVLHGIYGSGANWRTFAARLAEQQPDWGLVLVDLRMHGRSQDAPPPHTVAAAAADLGALTEHLTARGMAVRAISGHSFGGKVALLYRASPAGRALDHTWVLDASPSALPAPDDGQGDPRRDTVAQVLRLLFALPARFASRGAFVAHVTAAGFAPMLAQWLAMNLEPAADGDGHVMRLDPTAMEALLRDYQRVDAWPALAAGPGTAHVVIAGASDVVSAADRARLEALRAARAAVTVDEIPGASHWLHVDALDPLLALVAGALQR